MFSRPGRYRELRLLAATPRLYISSRETWWSARSRKSECCEIRWSPTKRNTAVNRRRRTDGSAAASPATYFGNAAGLFHRRAAPAPGDGHPKARAECAYSLRRDILRGVRCIAWEFQRSEKLSRER